MIAFSDETGRDALAALAEQCREILEWHKTGNLADGEVRRLASTMQESIPEHTRLHIAENKIATEAMKYVRQAALSASPVAQEPVASPGAESEHHLGWLFFNPDTGTEWADSHPIESGECDDAEELRPATLNNLKEELLSTWRDRERDDRLLNGAIEFLLAADGITGLSKLRINGEMMGARDVAQQLRGLEIGRLRRTPPATSAGAAADEIARAIPALIERFAYCDTRWPATARIEPDKARQFALALLSRAGDQSNSTHEEQSTQNI